jgi:hypothetical protein
MLNVTKRLTRVRRVMSLPRVWAQGAARAASRSRSAVLLPVLAQAQKTATEAPAEGGSWPILDWLIIVVLVGGCLFVICRSSRRN